MVKKICLAETADVFPGIVAHNRAVLEYEKFVHQTFYPYVIHPHSRFRVYWEITLLVVIPLGWLADAGLWVLLSRETFIHAFIITFLQLTNFVDLITRFFTGYVEYKTDIVILELKKIIPNYLFKFFIFDLVSCIPVTLIVYIWPELGISSKSINFHFIYIAKIFTVLKVGTFFLYLYHMSNLFLWDPFLLGLICSPFIVLLFYLVFLSVKVFHFFAILRDDLKEFVSDGGLELRSWLFIRLTDILIDYLSSSTNATYRHFKWRFPFLLVIFFSSIFILAYFTKFCLLKMTKEEKFIELESRILTLAKKRHLPPSLTEKILLYYFILLENKYCKEDEIFLYIPNTFKSEIFFHLCLPLLKNFYAFENLPTYVLRRLAECMTYQLYLPNEIVMSKAATTLSMFFILRGTLALYSAQDVELYHFEAGSSINGKNFVLGELDNNQYAISIEVTEVYRLDYMNYMDIMSAHPKMLRNILRKFHQNKSDLGSFVDHSLLD